MAPGSNTTYNPSQILTVLPEEVFGYVDLETLADIHRYLRESELSEDTDLARWIRENYLYMNLNYQGSGSIRTTEGFAQLDRAYRRVRSLTNKAQDKWPFFDRNFKQMSSTTVRNNARGEAAPGVMYHDEGARRSSGIGRPFAPSVTNGSETPNGPGLQAPFGTQKPSRYQVKKQKYQRPTQQIPVPLSSDLQKKPQERPKSENGFVPPEQPASNSIAPEATSLQELPKYTVTENKRQKNISESDGPTIPQSSDAALVSEEPEVARADSEVSIWKLADKAVSNRDSGLSEEPDVNPIPDAGGGKVRGPNGRYLPKDMPSLISKRSRKSHRLRVLYVKKAEFTKAKLAVSEDPECISSVTTPAEDESVFADVQTPSPSAHESDQMGKEELKEQEEQEEQEVHDQDCQGINDGITVTQPIMFSVVNSEQYEEVANEEGEEVAHEFDSIPAYLAAEADPVPSNLDRLPPSARRDNKRKSEPVSQLGQRKRGRYGGIVGRPRKSEQAAQAGEVLQEQLSANTEEEIGVKTRRSTRRSAVATEAIAQTPPAIETEKQPEPVDANDKELPEPVDEDDDDDYEKEQLVPVIEYDRKEEVEDEAMEQPELIVNMDEDEVMEDIVEQDTAGHGVKSPASASKLAPTKPAAASMQSKISAPGPPPESHQPTLPLQTIMHPNNQTSSKRPNGTGPVSAPSQNNSSGASATTTGVTADGATTYGAGPAHPPGQVEYFARIHTFTGTVEVPIAADQLDNDEEKMIRKYAEWNSQRGAMPIPYAQFQQLFAFAKQE
ncbi:hypothetical protein EJ02DRAFT_511021 [Clathrospora elynae]|uniref:Uncharacterized protein n=1 Tax=Clathrospora elynae TaxID=706981 RepID=A0A6A5SU50_9PLEO|nr:hypothetical protein EJ02DRAFT_511021 [Clathrospora elynae]